MIFKVSVVFHPGKHKSIEVTLAIRVLFIRLVFQELDPGSPFTIFESHFPLDVVHRVFKAIGIFALNVPPFSFQVGEIVEVLETALRFGWGKFFMFKHSCD